jgi:multidrug resistance efflux pump
VRIEGWVEKLFVNVTGQQVKKGDPLLTVYSPEMVAAQQEYLIALWGKDELGANGESDAKSNAASLQAAARRRLQLWDISDEQIARLENTREIEKYLTLYSPASGVVTEKSVLAGQKIMPGESLLVVADLSSVWGEADIYQSDLPHVKVGMPVELSLSHWPGKTFKGDVIFVTPPLLIRSYC